VHIPSEFRIHGLGEAVIKVVGVGVGLTEGVGEGVGVGVSVLLRKKCLENQ
jgi:hypothetical protein